MTRPCPEWWPDWTGETCVCIASGPSAKYARVDLAKGQAKAIAINNSWQLAPWADIFYACDGRWWREYLDAVRDRPALKLTSDKRASQELGLNYVEVKKPDDRALMDTPGEIGWGGNSGFHAINLAMQFGCARIILVGYDMTLTHGNHWHPDHKGELTNPTIGNVNRWRNAVDNIAPVARHYDIEIINCSDISSLRNYPKMKLEDAL